MKRLQTHARCWEYWHEDQKVGILLLWSGYTYADQYRVYLRQDEEAIGFNTFDEAESYLLARLF